jgi:hypothetical protein
MKIDKKFIENIFNLKVSLKNEKDKKKLSQYKELIPMFDIYTKNIYPIKKENLHYRLMESHYRFVNSEIYDWIKLLYEKNKTDSELKEKYNRSLKILSNYNIDILEETSYKTFYEFSPAFGLSISICKRNSFNPYMKNIKPYYTKLELIKLGQNMNILNINSIKNKEEHYKVCKLVSSNDISFDEIFTHTKEIVEAKMISWITYYSLTGSFLYNFILRNKDKIKTTPFINEGLLKIANFMKTTSGLKNNYYMYRFVWNDDFLKKYNIGDIFIDEGFVSTTRDPFYSPAIEGKFGIILIKINLPKDVKGIGLFIENFSLFPSEQEFLLLPRSKFKIIAKDDKFKYYHINKQFENIIHKKYELEFISNDTLNINKMIISKEYKTIDNLEDYVARGENRYYMIKNFVEEYLTLKVNFKNITYIFQCSWFDSSDKSSYKKIYFNKTDSGMLFSIYNNGYPYLNIEFGNKMCVNYLNKIYYYNDEQQSLTPELIDLICEFGRIFNYPNIIIFHEYKNFSEFKLNYNSNEIPFLYSNFYNYTIYNYLKNRVRIDDIYISNPIQYYNLEKFMNKELPKELKNKFNIGTNTFKETFIKIVEENFLMYDSFIYEIELLKDTGLDSTIISLKEYDYFNLNVLYYYYKVKNRDIKLIKMENEIDNYLFDLKFRPPIRRY